MLTRAALLLLTVLLVAACGGASGPEPSADEIRQRAAEAMSGLGSYRFRLEVLNGTMPLGGGLDATMVEGEVVAPDRLRMLVRARMGTMAVNLQAIAVGERQFLHNPLAQRWEDASGTLSLPVLTDPERGLAAVLRGAERLEKRGRVSQDGVDTYHLVGPIDAAALARLAGAPAAAPGDVQAELWVASGDMRLRRVKLVGAVVAGESADLERVLTLLDFGAIMKIEAPL